MNRVHRAISHMDSDGTRVLVGTERELVLWDFSERSAPQIQSRVRSGQVCCCVMSFPHAFCTGLFLNYGVQVWDMEKQEKIRSIVIPGQIRKNGNIIKNIVGIFTPT